MRAVSLALSLASPLLLGLLSTQSIACSDAGGIGDDGTVDADVGLEGDAFPADGASSNDAHPSDAGGEASAHDAIVDGAPIGAPTLPGETPSVDGATPVSITSGGETILRVETRATEHVHFMLTFPTTSRSVVLRVDRWDGRAGEAGKITTLGSTDAGAGLRTLAVFDGSAPATYWVHVIAGDAPFSGSLTITRTPFADGLHCTEDCAHLLQLPLPNDPAIDGYATDSGTVFRYWFGRRDMLMLLRNAAHRMIELKRPPFYPYDLSQWNGETPGTDTGALRHASHQRGKDVDVSLYGSDGGSMWRSFCTTHAISDGRECVAGTGTGLDVRSTARELAGFYEGGIVTMMFLDRELISLVRPAAPKLATEGIIDSKLVPLYSDGTHLQHWPNHDNHVHVRVSEGAKSIVGDPSALPVEPP